MWSGANLALLKLQNVQILYTAAPSISQVGLGLGAAARICEMRFRQIESEKVDPGCLAPRLENICDLHEDFSMNEK